MLGDAKLTWWLAVDTPESATGAPRPLVVLLAWIAAPQPAIAKLCHFLNPLGCDVVVVQPHPASLWVPALAAGNAQAVLQQLESQLQRSGPRPLLFAVFSGAAKAIYYKVLPLLGPVLQLSDAAALGSQHLSATQQTQASACDALVGEFTAAQSQLSPALQPTWSESCKPCKWLYLRHGTTRAPTAAQCTATRISSMHLHATQSAHAAITGKGTQEPRSQQLRKHLAHSGDDGSCGALNNQVELEQAAHAKQKRQEQAQQPQQEQQELSQPQQLHPSASTSIATALLQAGQHPHHHHMPLALKPGSLNCCCTAPNTVLQSHCPVQAGLMLATDCTEGWCILQAGVQLAAGAADFLGLEVWEQQRREMWVVLAGSWLACQGPSLFTYSWDDSVADPFRIQRLAQALRVRGASVLEQAWPSSSHCAHLRLHPVQCRDLVVAWLQEAKGARMNALLLRHLAMPRASSLQSFKEYRAAEAQNPQQNSVTSDGLLLEYETLELRLHPPNVVIDNETYDDATLITIDSANRPGTLIEVVQCLTELNLSIRRARISSDGGWFVDAPCPYPHSPCGPVVLLGAEFLVSETPRGKVTHPHKLALIRKVLSVDPEAQALLSQSRDALSVFELAGRDKKGLLGEVLQLLTSNGCEVWTYHSQVALVVSVLDALKRGGSKEEGLEASKLAALTQVVRGELHHERRLHHLLLLEELKSYELHQAAEQAAVTTPTSTAAHTPGPGSGSGSTGSGPHPSLSRLSPTSGAGGQEAAEEGTSGGAKPNGTEAGAGGGSSGGGISGAQPRPGPGFSSASHMAALPPTALLAGDLLNYTHFDVNSMHHLLKAEVRIQHSALLKYHLVTIHSKDRNKLFFDTVCTLADMAYDVYHGTIDSEGDQASQLFYVRPRYGDTIWDAQKANRLQYMLQCAVLRRFPRGLRVHLQTQDKGATPAIFAALSAAGFSITRAEVRTLSDGRVIFDLSLTDNEGRIPSSAAVQRACEAAGGVQADELDPLMQVASVGGAAAAAATSRPGAVDASTPGSSLSSGAAAGGSLPSNLGPRSGSMPTGLGGSQQGQGGNGSTTSGLSSAAAYAAAVSQGVMLPPKPYNAVGGKFHFALAGSSADRRRGTLGSSAGFLGQAAT
ncbi:hypothetical protein QJQ45_001043 [Haematococcus lacustris]|nr:hypothetical protein QJQ45_001043 [Haematococcus lacustris]